jgi:phospholipid N-methyltransferase
MNKFNTAIQLAKNLKTTGALYQTSKKLGIEISSRLPQKGVKVFVEFGLGHGNITQEILSKIDKDAKLYSFEVNEEFCTYVKKHIKDERLIIINEGAETLRKHISVPVDGIVSSLPLTFFSSEKRNDIMQSIKESLKADAYYSQIMYSKRLKKYLEETYKTVDIKTLIGIPMEYVYHCKV